MAWDRRRQLAAPVVGALAALGIVAMKTLPVRLEPGTGSWRLLVMGAPGGVLEGRAVVVLPGLDRGAPRQLLVRADSRDAGATSLGIAIDGAASQPIRTPAGSPALLVAPAAAAPGLRLDLFAPDRTASPHLRAIEVTRSERPPVAAALLAFLIAAALTAALSSSRAAIALGLSAAALLALAAAPALLWLTLPARASLWRALFPVALGLAGLGFGLGAHTAARRAALGTSALLAAVVFGAWVRGYFLPSTGSWDTEYWKAWMLRASSAGISRVYGDPGAVPAGRFLAQMRGEGVWKLESRGRAFVVDYPPLAMALWAWSWASLSRLATRMDHLEMQSVAVKLPSVLGDLAAVLVLLWALRMRPCRAAAMAGLYWALPVSWLSSAVLGFSDGSLAPLIASALVWAGVGSAGLSGACLALASLVKPTALIVAPAVAVALLAAGARLRKAIVSGLLVAAMALLPYALDGTLTAAVVHVYRILFQERLSGGHANAWWVLGHALAAAREGWSALLAPVPYVRIELVPFPARAVGSGLFALAALYVARRQRGLAGPGPAVLAGAALFFAYGMLGVGVHANHPHPMFLLLLATGLDSTPLRRFAAWTAATYVLNMLLLEGLGRFHGPRHALLEPLSRSLAGLRMLPGFDLTLLLAAANLALLAWLLASLRPELERLSGARGPAAGE